MELLLTQPRIDVNIKYSNNMTPLIYACFLGHDRVVRRLTEAEGIALNSRDTGGYTALHWAVKKNNLLCVKSLREAAGTDWNLKTNSGEYPLTMAVKGGQADILEVILSVPQPRLNLHVTDTAGRGLAQIAVENIGRESLRCVELLSKDRRVRWNINNLAGDTPVMFCLKNNKMEMVRVLLNSPRVDLNTRDRQGKYLENIAR